MISEGSCDTEDCNDAEHLALHHKNNLNFKTLLITIENSFIICTNISQYYCFDQIHADLVNIRDFKCKVER